MFQIYLNVNSNGKKEKHWNMKLDMQGLHSALKYIFTKNNFTIDFNLKYRWIKTITVSRPSYFYSFLNHFKGPTLNCDYEVINPLLVCFPPNHENLSTKMTMSFKG